MNNTTTIKPKQVFQSVPLFTRLMHVSEYFLLRLLVFFLNIMPRSVAVALIKCISLFIYYIFPKRRNVVMKNLDIAFGDSLPRKEKLRILRYNFYHIGLSFYDLFTTPRFVKRARKNVVFEGVEHAQKALDQGRGFIFVMSHLGSWEYLSLFGYLHNIPQTIIGKTLRNHWINKWMISLRRAARLETCIGSSGARTTLSELKNNHLVAMAIDQWGGNAEPWIDFFGTPASTTTMPARAAKKMRSALIPGFCVREAPGKFKIILKPAVPIRVDGKERSVEDITKELNAILESMVRQYPEQWMWTHNRWKDKKFYKINAINTEGEEE